MRFLAIVLFILLSEGAMAQGALDASGNFTGDIGTTAAAANRQTADALFRAGLENERRAWSTFPPNVGLLIKAAAQGMDGLKADDQAKEYGQAALRAVTTGTQSGQLDLSSYGTSAAQLNDYAHGSSSLMPEVRRRLEGYNMKLSADGKSMQTPLGTFSTDIDFGAMAKAVTTFARMVGVDVTGADQAIQQAVAERNAIAKQVAERVKAGATAAASQASFASTDSLGESLGNPLQESPPEESQARQPAAVLPAEPGVDEERQELQQQQAAFLQQRDALKQRLGMHQQSVKDPIGTPNQDIFKMVHTRYQILRSQDVFVEHEEFLTRVSAVPGQGPR